MKKEEVGQEREPGVTSSALKMEFILPCATLKLLNFFSPEQLMQTEVRLNFLDY